LAGASRFPPFFPEDERQREGEKGMEILKLLGFNIQYIVAGFSGGIVTLIFINMERSKAALSVLGGALVANYLAQPVILFVGRAMGVQIPLSAELGGAFICGLVAIKIVKGIYNRGEKFEKGEPVRPLIEEEDADIKGA
jgi:hypothetical protein